MWGDSFVLADSPTPAVVWFKCVWVVKKACGLFAAGQGEHPVLTTATSLLCVQSKQCFFTQLHDLVLVTSERTLSAFNVRNKALRETKSRSPSGFEKLLFSRVLDLSYMSN